MMTVAELIEELQELDPTLRVLVRGYEGGYNDVSIIRLPQLFAEDVNKEWYYGNHEEADGFESFNIFSGVVISE